MTTCEPTCQDLLCVVGPDLTEEACLDAYEAKIAALIQAQCDALTNCAFPQKVALKNLRWETRDSFCKCIEAAIRMIKEEMATVEGPVYVHVKSRPTCSVGCGNSCPENCCHGCN